MIEISKYNCKDKTEARIKEQYHYEELNSTLNSCPPYVNKKLKCNTTKSYESHINCSLHKKKVVEQNITISDEPKNVSKFFGESCDYSTTRKSQYERHIITDKHQILTNVNLSYSKNCVNYECSCGKVYKHASSLCAHKKNCGSQNNTIDISNNEFVSDKEIVMMVLNQNNELQTQMIEQQTQMIEQQIKMMELIKKIIIDKNPE
jgi:hypothetical protein